MGAIPPPRPAHSENRGAPSAARRAFKAVPRSLLLCIIAARAAATAQRLPSLPQQPPTAAGTGEFGSASSAAPAPSGPAAPAPSGAAAAGGPKPHSSSPEMVNPCLDRNRTFRLQTWCNHLLPIDERVEDMIRRMSLPEKIASLASAKNAVPSLGLPSYSWRSEAEHGIEYARFDTLTPYATDFSFPITTAMAFNKSLFNAIGAQVGSEARALANVGNAASTFWTPVINLAREPRWGRNFETPGEDPYLTGEYAAEFVRGFQESPVDGGAHLQASACCKHYDANSMEKSTEAGVSWSRHNFDANVTQQDLVDSYMAGFQSCVEKGRVSGLMCAYNSINGVPSCANYWLQQTVARDSWNFDGYITADCDADADYNGHEITPEQEVAAVLRAGTDNDCGTFVTDHAMSALNQSIITEADIEARLRMMFRVRMRLQHWDPPGPLQTIPTSVICSDAAKALARDGVVQAVAMLKNVGSTLPLTKGAVRSIALIGPNVKLSRQTNYYAGPRTPCDMQFSTMVDAISQYVPASKVFVANGTTVCDGSGSVVPYEPHVQGHCCASVSAPANATEIAAAVAMAKRADRVVLAVGTNLATACEGNDAASIAIPAGQRALIAAVAAASTKPVVVVTMTGVPLDIAELLRDPKIGAILHVGVPGVQTLGIADVVFGLRSPGGRTVQTIYPASYADQISIFDMNMRPGPSTFPRPDCNCTKHCCGNQCLCRNTTGEPMHYCACGAPGCSVPPISAMPPCLRGVNPGRTHRFYEDKPVVPFGPHAVLSLSTDSRPFAPATAACLLCCRSLFVFEQDLLLFVAAFCILLLRLWAQLLEFQV